ncbi:MAG: autotransporter-associated beta strand repeat-containing protein [Chthoniobacterales bacterium]|nr:autotransporter-associated beta strand repeat-containing protein [Chthoniobacterales bacterium]
MRSDNGASLTLVDGGISGGGAVAGLGGVTASGGTNVPAGPGSAAGSALFLYGGTAAFQISGGTSTLISDSISDPASSGGPAGAISKTGSGTLVLSGSNNHAGGTAINAGILQLGAGGSTGSIIGDVLNNGGLIVNRTGALALGGSITGSGSVTKLGTGTLTLSGTSSFGGSLSPNEGVLNITGHLTNNATSGIATTGSTATVNITGTNAGWTCTSDTLIGLGGGTGHLNISGGATASDIFSLVGRLAGNTGHVTVTGVGSQWSHSAGLVIGTGGAGTMLVSQGGQVTNTDGTIGGDAGSSGTVTVTGQDSHWTSSAYLVVGGNGTGTLNVSEEGTVKVGATGMGTLTLGNSGSGSGILNLGAPVGDTAVGAGTVHAETIAGGSGSGAKTVNFNHTNTSYTFAANLTGNLNVLQNAGTTILTGTNTSTANTVISNGTLAIAEGGALTFHIGGNGTNNAVTGTGSLQASGSFRFNLSAASTNIGDQWIIVAPGLAASYGTNFTAASFNGANGNWTNSTNGVHYVFQQSTGVLTVSSPPATNNYQAWTDYWQSIEPGFTNTAKTADPDGDSLRNDMEFALDGNPAVGSPALLTAVKAGANAIFNYAARKNPPGGVTYQVKAATNLATGPWTNSPVTVSNSANQSGLNIPADYERKEFVVPATGIDFYRVEAIIEP